MHTWLAALNLAGLREPTDVYVKCSRQTDRRYCSPVRREGVVEEGGMAQRAGHSLSWEGDLQRFGTLENSVQKHSTTGETH